MCQSGEHSFQTALPPVIPQGTDASRALALRQVHSHTGSSLNLKACTKCLPRLPAAGRVYLLTMLIVPAWAPKP